MDNMQLWLISSTDSINLNSGADGFYLNPDLDGLTGLPDIRSSNGVNAGYDGGWTSTQLWDARLITIRGLIVDKDGSQVEVKRKALSKLVGQGKTEPLTLKFVTEFGRTYTCTVRTTGCTMALQNIFSRQEYQIQLRADDPLIYDDGGDDIKATLRVQTDSEGFEIPFDIPLDISGGADPVIVDAGEDSNYPVITMYGELHSPTIVNQTTNQQLQLGADLSGDSIEWTEYDTATGDYINITNSTDYPAPITDFEMQGNATQNGTPTPTAPIAVQTTTGENVVKITGKNLFDKDNCNILNCWPTSVLAHGNNWAIWIPCEPNTTYSITKMICQPTDHNRFRIATTAVEPNYNVAVVNAVNPGNDNTTGQITTGDTAKYLIVVLANTDTAPTTTLSEMLGSVQIELGSTATTYEPYQGQEYTINLGGIELAKIGNYQDRIYKTDGKWYIEKQTGKYIFDGSSDENWYLSQNALKCNGLNAPTSQQYGQGYAPNNTGYNLTSSSLVAQVSNLEVAIRGDQALAGTKDSGVGLSSYVNGGGATDAIYIPKSSYTVATWKTLIQATPLICYYVLATTTTTEITEQALIDQLEAILSASLYTGVNNIFDETPNAVPTMDIEYGSGYVEIPADVAIIDCKDRTVTFNGVNAYDLLVSGSDFIELRPGDNKLYLTSESTGDGGYAEIKFKTGNLSI